MHIISLLDANTRDEFLPAINQDTNMATYLVGPVEASDLIDLGGIEGWNEALVEDVVAQGYLLQGISYELDVQEFDPSIGAKVYVKVTADATKWVEPGHDEDSYSL